MSKVIFKVKTEVRDAAGKFIVSSTRAYTDKTRLEASKRLQEFMELTRFAWRNHPGYIITGEIVKTEKVEEATLVIGDGKAVQL